MTRAISRPLLIVALVVLLLVIGAAAGGWWYLTQGQYPLAGTYRHDFGLIPWGERYATATHTFVLRNRTEATIVIDEPRPGCGCVEATASTLTIPPGETVEIEAMMKLGKPGERDEHIKISLNDGTVQMLFVYARTEGQSPYEIEQARIRQEQGIVLGPAGIPMEVVEDDGRYAPRIIVPEEEESEEEEEADEKKKEGGTAGETGEPR